jgi:GGDEF domain-containing protein
VDHVGAGTFTKPLLVELSHTIERLALAADPAAPTVVVAMFQRLAYFRREADVYRDIAARGAVTIVGLADDVPALLPPGVKHVLLDPEDDLIHEWSVTVLGPRAGATLVAADLETLEPTAATAEHGRTFRAGWSFRREEARRQVLRLRSKLSLDVATAAGVDAVLRTVAGTPEPVNGQAPWDEALRFLAGRVAEALRQKAAGAAALAEVMETTERDRHTNFYTEVFLHRWLAGAATGTLPMGLALLQLPGLAAVRERYGRRAELAVLRRIADGVAALTRDGDRVVTLGPEDFLVVLPSAGPDDVLRVCNEVCRIAAGLDEAYPFVALPAKVAGTVTRERPLPIDRLRQRATSDRLGVLVPI